MLKDDVIAHFGSAVAVARALKITKGAVSQWPSIVPRGSAYQVQVITGGRLQVDPSDYPAKKKPDVVECSP
jgi:DNA-binding transcriptional regulator YdaS (Cro superfamily)